MFNNVQSGPILILDQMTPFLNEANVNLCQIKSVEILGEMKSQLQVQIFALSLRFPYFDHSHFYVKEFELYFDVVDNPPRPPMITTKTNEK